MDWELAIRRNREALERILAALFSLVGLADGPHPERSEDGQDRRLAPKAEGGPRRPHPEVRAEGEPRSPHPEVRAEGEPRRTLPRHLHAYALRILRATEAAIRRLVVIAARELIAQPRPAGEGMRPDLTSLRIARGQELAGPDAPIRIPAFPLLDPLKRFPLYPPRRASKSFPRICVVGFTEPTPIPEKPVLLPDDPLDATGLCRRLLSSRRALANLPREARRLARWKARNKLRLSRSQGRGRISPLRIGYPPGRRKRPTHAVDDVLKECHALALDVLSPPDTS